MKPRGSRQSEFEMSDYSGREIAISIRALGIRRGDSVVVHSSYKSIGNVDGGPRAVIEALIDVVLPEVALLFPNLFNPHCFTVENPPRFDLKGAHVRNLGVIPDLFKFNYADHFSVHPTHSMMGIGARAEEIAKDHEKAGCCCGWGTPWTKNASSGGWILLIGVDQRSNTSYHSTEEQMEDSFKLTEQEIHGTVVIDGAEFIVPSRLHLWTSHADFNILNPELEASGRLKRGRIGDAKTMCLDARGFLDLALRKLRQDREYFLVR